VKKYLPDIPDQDAGSPNKQSQFLSKQAIKPLLSSRVSTMMASTAAPS
jgi:hypothetical protein